jgi:ornithine cyclodeaminase/alanine dehydrogenase-like protein (mu-crystallin family)
MIVESRMGIPPFSSAREAFHPVHTTLLTIDDIRQLVRSVGIQTLMRSMIAALEAAFIAYDETTTVVPPRSGFSYDEPYSGLIEWMPALRRGGTVTLKLVGYHPHNPHQHELPTIVSSIGVYDVSTGLLRGMMDGTFLTALRTGAVSAIASRYLARSDSHTVAIVGAGAQAVTQLHALSTVFEVRHVSVYDVDASVSESFARRVAFLDIPVTVASEAELPNLVATADILVTATSTPLGSPPVIPDTPTNDWLHINAIGSDFPGKTEIPLGLLRRAFVVPDFPEQARAEGECQQLAPDDIGPALHVVMKNADDYADKREQLTVFDSTGWALADAVAAQFLLDLAHVRGVGRAVNLQHVPVDPHNPYDFSI